MQRRDERPDLSLHGDARDRGGNAKWLRLERAAPIRRARAPLSRWRKTASRLYRRDDHSTQPVYPAWWRAVLLHARSGRHLERDGGLPALARRLAARAAARDPGDLGALGRARLRLHRRERTSGADLRLLRLPTRDLSPDMACAGRAVARRARGRAASRGRPAH